MTIQQDRLETLRQAEELADNFAFLDFFRKHPELNSMANENLIRSYLNGDPINADTLEQSRQFLGSRLGVKNPEQMLAANEQEQQNEADRRLQDKVSAAGHRADVSSEILSLISDKESRDYEAKQQKYKTTEQLESRLAELKLQKQLSGMSTHDVKKFIQIEREKKIPQSQEQVSTPLDNMTRSDIRKLNALELRALISYPNGQPNPAARKKLEQIMGGN